MSYGILVQEKVAALNIDSLNRPCVSASPIENGMVMNLLTKDTTSGSEVWTATNPVTGSLTNLWMAYEPEIVLTSSAYKGIDPDPRNFRTEIGDMFTAFKLQIGDLIMITPDGLSGSRTDGDFVVAANGDFQLTWSATAIAGTTLNYLYTGYISIGTGAIGGQRIVAYKFEVTNIDT